MLLSYLKDFISGKLKTALYFAHKACNKTVLGDRPKSEAMVLKALVLLDLGMFHFFESSIFLEGVMRK